MYLRLLTNYNTVNVLTLQLSRSNTLHFPSHKQLITHCTFAFMQLHQAEQSLHLQNGDSLRKSGLDSIDIINGEAIFSSDTIQIPKYLVFSDSLGMRFCISGTVKTTWTHASEIINM